MISSAEIGQIIDNPYEVQKFSIEQIREVRDKFPYASTFHLLLLKNVSLKDDLNFEIELNHAAAHVLDRERLYYLIQNKSVNENPIELTITKDSLDKTDKVDFKTETKPSQVTSNQAIKNSVITEENGIDKLESTELKEPIESRTKESITIPDSISTEKLQHAENIEHEKIVEHQEKSQENINEIAPDLADIVYEITLEEELKGPKEQEINLTKSEVVLEDKISTEARDNKEIELEEKALISTSIAPKISESELANLSFVEWLKYKKSHKIDSTIEIEAVTPQIEHIQSADKSESITSEISSQNKKTGLSRKEIDDLLNKFITEEPSISKPQSNFFNPVKNAKQSLKESEDLVTETLAKIYVLQKNYTKAIKAYEQLSLVYPEKKTFFASQIKKIKEQIK